MHFISKESFLWTYLQPEIRELLNDGEHLMKAVERDGLVTKLADFSFLVFPFSKAYEGFLKKLFLDVKLIKYEDYYSDDIRIGRVLNPNYEHEAQNVFSKLTNNLVDGREVSEKLWDVWKNGRNLVFHYFPHNYKRLSYTEAQDLIIQIIEAMEAAVNSSGLNKNITTLATK
jgi:hypothetical protein